jgi:uncharacterized protein YjbI with pentapeptide repeats
MAVIGPSQDSERSQSTAIAIGSRGLVRAGCADLCDGSICRCFGMGATITGRMCHRVILRLANQLLAHNFNHGLIVMTLFFLQQIIRPVVYWGLLCLLSLTLWTAPAWAEDYDRVNLSHSDLSGQDLRDASFNHSNLRYTDLHQANLAGVSLFGSKLKGANLAGADLRIATLDNTELVEVNLNNAILEGAYAHSAQFQGATIVGADFTDVDLRSDAQDLLCSVAEGVNPVTHRATRDTLNCD